MNAAMSLLTCSDKWDITNKKKSIRTNYTFFSIEDDNLYTAKIYSGNTVIYAAASHEYRDELVDLLRQMVYYK